ncbi:hypothetical protein QR680_013845 [Steinernema hermaphroditum]|uniref:Metalloendopeptidase n=1 Tax=Steinernema hermaphroditum TaxID=289476 RepID=A0AA39I6V9_9BILA|nr:hypothetical protein QR680_013845 [Steinernema hermaphroditum]
MRVLAFLFLLAADALSKCPPLWASNERIPFYVSEYILDDTESAYIRKVFNDFSKLTCLRFEERERPLKSRGINIEGGEECALKTDNKDGIQRITLGDKCWPFSGAASLIGASLGLTSTHTRSDRDDFITLHPEHARGDVKKEFWQKSDSDNLGLRYDFGSMMHPVSHFGADDPSKPTILVQEQYKRRQYSLGNSIGPAFSDIQMLNKMYKCDEKCAKRVNLCKNSGFMNPNDCTKAEGNFEGKPCGSTLFASEEWGTLNVKNIWNLMQGERLSNLVTCHWRIKASRGRRLRLKLKTVDNGIDERHSCAYAGVELKVNNFNLAGYKYCKQEQRPEYHIFETDADVAMVNLYDGTLIVLGTTQRMDGMVITVLETTVDLASAALDAEEMDGPSQKTDLMDAEDKVNSEKIKAASDTVTLSQDVVELEQNGADATAVVLENCSLEVMDAVAIAIAIGMEQAPPQVLRYLRSLPASLCEASVLILCLLSSGYLSSACRVEWSSQKPIRYFLSKKLPEGHRTTIHEAITFYEQNTCLSFRELASPIRGNGLRFIFGNDCSSSVGRNQSPTMNLIILGDGCDSFANVTHEIGHSLGLIHTHQRKDRDSYVSVNNYRKNWANDFEIERIYAKTYGVPYDYGSIMHYEGYSDDAVDPSKPVILAKDRLRQFSMGNDIGPALSDLLLLNRMYKCDSICAGQVNVCKNSGFMNPNDCSKCICPFGFGGRFCQFRAEGNFRGAPCGGTIITESGKWHTLNPEHIWSIANDVEGHNIATCHWHIKAMHGKKLEIKLEYVNNGLEVHRSCQQGGVELKVGDFDLGGYRYCKPEHVPSNHRFRTEGSLAVVNVYATHAFVTFRVIYRAV